MAKLYEAEILEKPEPRKRLFVYRYYVLASAAEHVEGLLRDDGRLRHEGDKLIHVEEVQGHVVMAGITQRTRADQNTLDERRGRRVRMGNLLLKKGPS